MPGIFRPTYTRPAASRWIPTAAAAAGVVINVDVAGNITWTGQSVALVTTITPTAGAVTWTGQAVGLKTSITPTAGAVTWTGQTVGLKTTITPTAGAVTWTGSALGLKTTVTPTAGNVTWAGATDITLVAGGNVVVSVTTPGAITWTGQAVGLTITIVPTAGAVTWAGQALSLKTSLAVTAGNITWTGQTVSVIGSGSALPVKGPTRKLVLSGQNAISVPITFGSYDDTHVWDTIYDSGASYDGEDVLAPSMADVTGNGQADSEELVTGAPRAVLVGSGRNSVQEV